MPDADVPGQVLAAIEVIARAVRDEPGEEVDAYPGARSPGLADPLNRAFRAVVLAVLRGGVTDREVSPALVSQALRRLAARRLAADGFDPRGVRLLLAGGPGSPDDWLTFLILSSRRQVDDALEADGTCVT